jgi:hypothetical protein
MDPSKKNAEDGIRSLGGITGYRLTDLIRELQIIGIIELWKSIR